MKTMRTLVLVTLLAGALADSKDFYKYYDKFLSSNKKPDVKKGLGRMGKFFDKPKLGFEDFKATMPGHADGSAYDVIDRDNDGVIWFQELMSYSKYMTGNPHSRHIAEPPTNASDDDHEIIVQNMLRQANPNGLPYATKQQFANWRARQAFDSYDEDQDGVVTHNEMATRMFDPDVVRKLRHIRQNPATAHNASNADVHRHPFDRACRNPAHNRPMQAQALEEPAMNGNDCCRDACVSDGYCNPMCCGGNREGGKPDWHRGGEHGGEHGRQEWHHEGGRPDFHRGGEHGGEHGRPERHHEGGKPDWHHKWGQGREGGDHEGGKPDWHHKWGQGREGGDHQWQGHDGRPAWQHGDEHAEAPTPEAVDFDDWVNNQITGMEPRRRLWGGSTVESGCNLISDGQEHWCNAAGAVVDCTTGNYAGCASGVWDSAKDIWDKWG